MNLLTFNNLSYGVYIASAMDSDRAIGCIANSAMQVTNEPNTIAVSINKQNYTHKIIEETKSFAISVLPETIDPKVIGTFGFCSSKDNDKFAEVDYQLAGELPVLSESCGYFVCKLVNSMDCGTHTVFLGEVIECEILSKDNPMTYSYYHKVVKGAAPKTAPTYIAPELLKEADGEAKYICSVCSYEYDGDIPFDELPDDYVCPICSQGKEVFDKI